MILHQRIVLGIYYIYKKSVSVLPFHNKDEFMISNSFQAAISLWQNCMSAWFRVWSEFFKYPTTITEEIGFFRPVLSIQREQV
jgi:hypothetical protein